MSDNELLFVTTVNGELWIQTSDFFGASDIKPTKPLPASQVVMGNISLVVHILNKKNFALLCAPELITTHTVGCPLRLYAIHTEIIMRMWCQQGPKYGLHGNNDYENTGQLLKADRPHPHDYMHIM